MSCNLCQDPLCYECHDYENITCSVCKTHAHLASNICVCDSDAFYHNDTETCDVCSDVCYTCTGPTFADCVECNGNLFIENLCVDYCPIGYYVNGTHCELNSTGLVFNLLPHEITNKVYDS